VFEAKLIALYFYVCERYEEELKYECLRFSNNNKPKFSDQEALTIYLYAVSEERRFQIREIHCFAKRYLRSWFPLLPSYQAFNTRLNRLCVVMQRLCAELLEQHLPEDLNAESSLVDSFPIITCSGKRQGKVAGEITAKGYCSTKCLYYYGLRIHALAWRRKVRLPWLESMVLSSAAENDLSIFKENWSEIENRTFYGDKIYQNKSWFGDFYQSNHSEMLTPVKAVKGMPESLKQWDKAADNLYSRAVSAIRQPIESFFNWLNEKTDIQTASKVRSTKGLLVHVFGKITAAFIYCIFNP
jgi:hypothetical protein